MAIKRPQGIPDTHQSEDRKTSPMLEIIKRNPRSVATALGGIVALAASSVWVLRSLARGSKRD